MFDGIPPEQLYGLAAFYLLLCGIVALIAPSRGKSAINGFLISLLLSPLIGFLVVVLLPPENQRKCPDCGEMIRKDAKLCRFCQRELA